MLNVCLSGVFSASKNRYIKINAYLRNDIRLVHVRLAKAYGHFKMEIGESTRVVFSHFYIYALHNEDSHDDRRADLPVKRTRYVNW